MDQCWCRASSAVTPKAVERVTDVAACSLWAETAGGGDEGSQVVGKDGGGCSVEREDLLPMVHPTVSAVLAIPPSSDLGLVRGPAWTPLSRVSRP